MKYIIRIALPVEGIKAGVEFRTRGHRGGENEQATFRIVAIRGRDRGEKVRLFATNTSLKARRIRKRWEMKYRTG